MRIPNSHVFTESKLFNSIGLHPIVGKSVVISVRIPEELKEELEKWNIDEAEVIRRALTNEVKKVKAKELEKEVKEIKDVISKISVEEVTKEIREDRDSR
ncbi:hypothetical protein MetMK1DRAFT_00002710 [Metallosphaera yellowstonensis MK1]|uniref:VapB-type antitoxin n=1 Tax=Metallosphaera yellowstonensis MK1 TaxID=671065 RepID=H2C4A4_9CREN|nr:hypothetical protein MetMK1DRAFT_00002710 [Metallosphaera yellowstonensis MK1]